MLAEDLLRSSVRSTREALEPASADMASGSRIVEAKWGAKVADTDGSDPLIAANEVGEPGVTLAVMTAASVSGFVMGLLVRGEGAIGLAAFVFAFALVWSGWWLRGAAQSASPYFKK